MAALLYGSILFGSFVKLWGIDNTFTLKNYQDLMSHGVPVLLDTMYLSLLAAIPSAGLGLLIAYLTLRHRFFGRTAFEFSAMLSYAIPGTVMGIGYILAFNAGALQLTGTGLIIILGIHLPRDARGDSQRSGRPRTARPQSGGGLLHSQGRNDHHAASRGHPADPVGDHHRPDLQFCSCHDGGGQVIFLVSPGHDLVTILILSWAGYGTIGRGAALSTLLILVLAACILPEQWLSRRPAADGSVTG